VYKSPSSLEKFQSYIQANKNVVLGALVATGAAHFLAGDVMDNMTMVTASMAVLYAGTPAVALMLNIQKIQSSLTEKFMPERFKQQQQEIRARFDDFTNGDSNESILAIANDAVNKKMISESMLSAIAIHAETNKARAMAIFDGPTQQYINTEVKAKIESVERDSDILQDMSYSTPKM
jgi:hypothetical protein